MNCKH